MDIDFLKFEMQLCAHCNKRANRFCVALGTQICSQCCGRYRRIVIECSENCRFLLESRRQALKKLLSVYGNSEFELTWFELLHNLRFALVQIKMRVAPALTDDEAGEALANVVDSRRIQEKGLIYEYKSVNPNVQQATAALFKVISIYEKMKVQSSTLDNCVKYLLRQAQSSKNKGADFIQLTTGAVGTRFINIDMPSTVLTEEKK